MFCQAHLSHLLHSTWRVMLHFLCYYFTLQQLSKQNLIEEWRQGWRWRISTNEQTTSEQGLSQIHNLHQVKCESKSQGKAILSDTNYAHLVLMIKWSEKGASKPKIKTPTHPLQPGEAIGLGKSNQAYRYLKDYYKNNFGTLHKVYCINNIWNYIITKLTGIAPTRAMYCTTWKRIWYCTFSRFNYVYNRKLSPKPKSWWQNIHFYFIDTGMYGMVLLFIQLWKGSNCFNTWGALISQPLQLFISVLS